MKFHNILSIMFLLQAPQLTGQQFYAREGLVAFVADAPLEKIEGKSGKIVTGFHSESLLLEISLDMKSFEFSHPLLKYHFEKYIAQTDSFPRASFIGKVQKCNRDSLLLGKEQDVTVVGTMNFHGKYKEMVVTGKLRSASEGTGIWVKSSFDLVLKDFGIEIPPFVRDAWASIVQVQMETVLQRIPQK